MGDPVNPEASPRPGSQPPVPSAAPPEATGGAAAAPPIGNDGDAAAPPDAGPGVEQRREPRVTIDAFVRLADGDREYVFRTRDLSMSGLFLYTRIGHVYPIKVGSTLDLELYDQELLVRCRVVVVRLVTEGSPEAASYPTGFGVRIANLDERSRETLARMLARGGGSPAEP